jgi:hypothetical protein
MLPEDIQTAARTMGHAAGVPEVGELVHVRSRRWLVDEVIEPQVPGQTCVVRLSCADDDAQGQSLDVLWNYELHRSILKEEGWADLAARGRNGRFRHTEKKVVLRFAGAKIPFEAVLTCSRA